MDYSPNATHADLMKLTRRLVKMPLGDLVALHRVNAYKTSGPFLRGVLMARMAIDSERASRTREGARSGKARSDAR